MKPIAALVALPLLAVTACVPRPQPSAPVQTRPTPTPAPTPAPVATFASWLDAPQTPGDWTLRTAPGGTVAQFAGSGGASLFSMRCDGAARTLVLSRVGAMSGSAMIIRSETQSRSLRATAVGGALESRIAASDRMLDAIALSKGRFAVEIAGTPTLYLPSWAEVSRVIEDCR